MPNNHPSQNSLSIWQSRLYSLAMQRLANTPLADPTRYTDTQKYEFIANFRDDLGNRRESDALLLIWLLNVSSSSYYKYELSRVGVEPTQSLVSLFNAARSANSPLWLSLLINTDVADCISQNPPRPEPLCPATHYLPIEIWTEAELTSLHALSNIASTRQSSGIIRRAYSAAEWLIENVQPDNATQRPWAIHVFLTMAHDNTLPESTRSHAQMYAETLLHNAMIPMGPQVPDIFSACILLDSASLLQPS